MASATIVSNLETHSSIAPSIVHPEAIAWADKVQKNLLLVAAYDDLEFVPFSVNVDESILNAPRRHSANKGKAELVGQVAQLLYPSPNEPLGSLIKYEKDIVRLRKFILQQRKRAIDVATEKNKENTWHDRILQQGAWEPIKDPLSLDGAPSLPMPVKIAEPETLEPFFEHLRSGGTDELGSTIRSLDDAIQIDEEFYGTKALEFEKGVVYSDRRMDLCKMVLGPTNIGGLIESLKANDFITHFLLGNNIIGPHGAKCIADFLKEYPNRIDTWYLAGNCIDAPSLKLLVDHWVGSTSVSNIWLKRNPLGPTSATDLFRLIVETPNLRTLDLDQTELGDAGVTELFTRLAEYKGETQIPLKHIYLNGVGIGKNASEAIARYLATGHCTLDSLYMQNNPTGSEGASALANGLKNNKSLTRLAISSVGLGDAGAVDVCEALDGHPSISMLDLGQSYSTADLGMRYNFLTDRSSYAIHNMILSCPKLSYLNLGSCALTHAGLNEILEAILTSSKIIYYYGRTIHSQDKSSLAVKAGQKHAVLAKQVSNHLTKNVRRTYGMDYATFIAEEKRWVVNDKISVRKIDSVYRNRDTNMARKGLKTLDKWWDEDDKTLDDVMKAAVGPVCTKKLNAVGPVCTLRKQKEGAL